MNIDFTSVEVGYDFRLIIAICLPLLIVPVVLNRRWKSFALIVAPLTAGPALILSIWVEPGLKFDVSWFLLSMRLGIDEISKVFLLFTSILWAISGIYARSYLVNDKAINKFFAFFLVTMAGNFGLIIAQEMVSFFLFFSIMSFAAFGLVTHDRSPEALRAGKVYIALVVIGEVLIISGILLISGNVESLEFNDIREGISQSSERNIIIGLILAGFGIKVGALPLHVWLPLAHPVAPTPASAVLSGTMIKAGLIAWLRFLPIGETALPGWGNLLIIVGLVSAFCGVLIGLIQKNPKTVLAYSSISQMGFMTVAVGIGFSVPEAAPLAMSAAIVYSLHHSLAKGALFLGTSIVKDSYCIGVQRVLLFIGLIIPALSLSCAPLTSGAIAKLTLKNAIYVSSMPWLINFISLASAGTTVLMGRFLLLLFDHSNNDKPRLNFSLVLLWSALLICVVIVTWLYVPEQKLYLIKKTVSVSSFWPVVFGVFIVWVALRWGKYFFINKVPHIPAGDLLVLVEPFIGYLQNKWKTDFGNVMSRLQDTVLTKLNYIRCNICKKEILNIIEGRLMLFGNAGILVLVLTVIFFLLNVML